MSTNPQESIQEDLKQALKAGDKERLATLRLLLSAIKNEAIRTGQPVDQKGFLQLVQKAIKQRRESAEGFRQGEREESARKEEREAQILAEYLPPQASEDEIREAVSVLIDSESLEGPSAIGLVMKAMIAKFKGQADGGTINRIARELLEKRS